MLQGIDGSEEAQEAPPAPAHRRLHNKRLRHLLQKQEPTSQPKHNNLSSNRRCNNSLHTARLSTAMYQQPVYINSRLYEQTGCISNLYINNQYISNRNHSHNKVINVQSIKLQQFD
jgi:hypothetical protein